MCSMAIMMMKEPSRTRVLSPPMRPNLWNLLRITEVFVIRANGVSGDHRRGRRALIPGGLITRKPSVREHSEVEKYYRHLLPEVTALQTKSPEHSFICWARFPATFFQHAYMSRVYFEWKLEPVIFKNLHSRFCDSFKKSIVHDYLLKVSDTGCSPSHTYW